MPGKPSEYWLERIWRRMAGQADTADNTSANGMIVGGLSGGTVSLAAGEAHVGQVGGTIFASKAEFTRPNDVNQYGAGDIVSNSTAATTPLEFTNVARIVGGGVTIGAVKLCKNNTVVTNANYRLWLYSATPATPPVDNAVFAQLWANRDLRVGWVDFSNPILGSDCVTYQGVLSMLGPDPIIPADKSVFGLLQVTSAYIPTAQEIYSLYVRGWSE